MDVLSSAYSTASDDDVEEELLEQFPSKRLKVDNLPPLPKRSNPLPHVHPSYYPKYPEKETFVPGRYVSKREKAVLSATSSTSSGLVPPSVVITSPGSISDSNIRHDILSSLKSQAKGIARERNSKKLYAVLNSHSKAVNAIQWSSTHAHLLASAGMDQTVHIWNVWAKDTKDCCVFNFHGAAVKDVIWSQQGLSVLSCGYDYSSRLIDVEKGTQMQQFKEDQVVGVIKFHPWNHNLFLSGGSKGLLRMWDIRSGKVVHEYMRSLGPILDVEFSVDSKSFISSSDISKSNISENSIIVWDVLRQVPLSNQVYVEAYTCPSIKFHPFEQCFVAQSNGNYIAVFSSKPPFRLDKFKRYEKHSVSGFPIKCNFSSDGEILSSGSSDGYIYLYNYKSSELLQKIKAHEQPCLDVALHPHITTVIASCSWSGEISIFE